MAKKAVIVHGWGGKPYEAWQGWLANKLIGEGLRVSAPSMPNTNTPRIDAWVGHLRRTVPEPNEDITLVGHSIGCQTIVRFLAGITDSSRVNGVVLVAPWTRLNVASYETDADRMIAAPWIATPIDWNAAKAHTTGTVAIFSDNDPYVSLREKRVFEEKLGAKVHIEGQKGHMNEESGTRTLPSALQAVDSFLRKRNKSV